MADNEKLMTIIGADTQFRGELTFERSARILGQFEGKINAHGELHVAEGAVCKAEITAGSLIVDGTVQGNVQVAERVQLNAKGKIHGDVTAPKFVVADGAVIVGNCTVGSDGMKVGRTTATSTGAPPRDASTPLPSINSRRPSTP